MGGFGSKFVPTIFEQRFFAETRPYGAHVWKIGAGANMASVGLLLNGLGSSISASALVPRVAPRIRNFGIGCWRLAGDVYTSLARSSSIIIAVTGSG